MVDLRDYYAVIVWAPTDDGYHLEAVHSVCSVCGGKLPNIFTRCRRCVSRPRRR